MFSRARRWADTNREMRLRRLANLETAFDGALRFLEIGQITAPSEATRERLLVWRKLLKEDPARPGG